MGESGFEPPNPKERFYRPSRLARLRYSPINGAGRNRTAAGPLVGVIPVDTHLDEKKLAKVSGNKKVNMVPLKNLLKTTGYVHGANTPVGIYEKFQYPIFIDTEAKEQGEIYVSSGKVGRSVKLNAEDLAGLVHATFADLEQK